MSELLSEIRTKNGFLDLYLKSVENTESPRIFHVWSLITGVAACLGRRVYLPFGMEEMYPNMYTVLVGPPATRKNFAINATGSLLKSQTRVKFAPDDTGGQRQGLITAFAGKKIDEDDPLLDGIELANGMSVEAISDIDMGMLPDSRDQCVLFAKATELISLLGINSMEMITFLNKVYDGEDYNYGLRKEQDVLVNPLFTILGGATPTNLAKALPTEAVGQGFMSRLVLVHDTKRYKDMPEGPEIDRVLWRKAEERFKIISYDFAGEMTKTAGAKKRIRELYRTDLNMNDTRFIFYQERRQTHLLKTAMCLATMRKSMEINEQDIDCAHLVLSMTEATMPDALGEYGMSPIAAAKQKMIEFVKASTYPVTKQVLRVLMQRDMKLADFHLALVELENAGTIKQVDTSDGPAFIAIDKSISKVDDVMNYLAKSRKRANGAA